MLVYKYLSPARVNVLTDGMIRFTQPLALNDPFETRPDLTIYKKGLALKIAQRTLQTQLSIEEINLHIENCTLPPQLPQIEKILAAIPGLVESGIEEMYAKINKTMGILSLSETRNNLLMWSHYAESHRGLVIGFDSQSDFFVDSSKGKGLLGLRKVAYSSLREKLPHEGFRNLSDTEKIRANDAFMFTKSADWSYEREHRILSLLPYADLNAGLDDLGCDICLWKFPPDCIKEIIWGHCSTVSTQNEIRDIAASKYPQASLFQARISDTRFDLDILPFS